MSRYKGYLTGVNPNYVRKLVQDEDPRYFAYESATGTFVNGRGEEVKSMKEAVAINDKIDAELKLAFPPQKAVGAKPFRAKRMTPTQSYQQIKKIDNAEKKLGNVNTLGSGVFYDLESPIDKLLRQRKEMEKSRLESIEAEKRLLPTGVI